MAISVIRAVEGHEPPGRQNALIPVRTKRGTLAVYALFFVPLFFFSVAFPGAPLVAWLVFYRMRNYRWSPLFKFCVTLASFFSLLWFSLVLGAHASTVYGALGAGGYVAALLARPLALVVGSLAGGSAAGLMAAWWDWQRKPFYKQPDKAPTLVQQALMRRERQAIAAGEFGEPGMITLGIEDGPRSLGRVVQIPISEMTHGVILGTTNTGKTQTSYRFIEGFVSPGLPVIGLDMKGSRKTIATMRAFAQKYGRPFYLFTLTGGGRWDALRDKPNPSAQKDVLMSIGAWSDAHYKTLADGALLDIFSALQVGGPGAGESMVQAAARLLDPAQLQQYANKHLAFADHSDLRARVLARANQISANPNAFSGVKGQLDAMVYSETGQFFAPGEGMFSLRQAFNESAVVLFSFDYMSYPVTSQAVSAMVLADVKSLGAVLMNEGNEKPWLFWADEFTKARAGDVAPMMQQIREAKAKILLSTQGIADILGAGTAGYEGGGESYKDIVLSQASLMVCHSVERATADYIQGESGEAWLIEAGSVETSRKDSILDADSGASGDRGFAKVQVGPGVKAAQIMELQPGCAVMIGRFEVGRILKEDKPARKPKKGDPSPKLLVNYCRVVRSQVAVDADEMVDAGQLAPINEVDPDAVPVQLEATALPEPASGPAGRVPGPVAGLGPAGTATPAAGGGGVAPFMFDKKNEGEDGEPEYGGFF